MTKPHHPIGGLRLNLYGTKTACHMYHEVLDAHLRAQQFTVSVADPYMYVRGSPGGTTITAIKIDDFLVLAPTHHLLHEFRDILRKTYTVKDLGSPMDYLGWHITRKGQVPIHAVQPVLIENALARATRTDANPRPSPFQKNPHFPFNQTHGPSLRQRTNIHIRFELPALPHRLHGPRYQVCHLETLAIHKVSHDTPSPSTQVNVSIPQRNATSWPSFSDIDHCITPQDVQ